MTEPWKAQMPRPLICDARLCWSGDVEAIVSAANAELDKSRAIAREMASEVMELREELARANRVIASLEEVPTSTDNPIPVMDHAGAVQ